MSCHRRVPPGSVFITLFTQISAQVLYNEDGSTGISRGNTSHVLSIDKDLARVSGLPFPFSPETPDTQIWKSDHRSCLRREFVVINAGEGCSIYGPNRYVPPIWVWFFRVSNLK